MTSQPRVAFAPFKPRTRRARGWLVAAALLSALLVPSQAGAATSPDYYGLNVQTLFRLDTLPVARWGSFLDQMRTGGMTRARTDAHWQYVEPNGPGGGQHRYVWYRSNDPRASMDYQARILASRGIRMVPVLSHAPPWTSGSGTRVAPQFYDDLGAFAAAYAKRYGPDGDFWRENPDLPELAVHEYELWTEANSTIFWTGGPNPAEYVAATRAVRSALKAEDPSAKLLASIGWQNFGNFMRQLYAGGIKGQIDGVGFHPYAPHAPAIIDLVRIMRNVLREVGDGALPIWLTETGQPVTYTGAGGPRADSGVVSDAARAATQTLTGDALARSDCDVRDFQVYTITASESGREPIGEGFMGVMRFSDASPNATGRALIRASLRWRAAQTGGIVICGPGQTAEANLLPLDLQLEHVRPTCVKGVTTYDGNPMEAAVMHVLTGDGRDGPGYVNAFGNSEACIPNGPPVWEFDVISKIPNIAQSQRYRCTVPTTSTIPPGSCRVVTDAPALAGAEAVVAKKPREPSAPVCRWKASTKVLKAKPKSATVRAGVGCSVASTSKFTVSLVRGKKTIKLRTATLRTGATSTLSLKRKLRKGERIVLANKAEPRRKIPKLSARTAAIGGADAPGSQGCDWKLEARVLGGASSKAKTTRLRARMTCAPKPTRRLKFKVAVQKKGKKKAQTVRSVTLQGGRLGNVTLKRRLRVGDRVILSRAADTKNGLPSLTARATTFRKVVTKR
ncbi:MAG: hypothetical protein JHC95_02360 [Solirubrobacteraceae bacterium]|nr:hypothetical protein [Solirubrobacteraceae bacterium]